MVAGIWLGEAIDAMYPAVMDLEVTAGYSYDRRAAKSINLEHHGLDGLVAGSPTALYHGTTKLFRKFDISLSRDELVNKFYGRGIFLTPSKTVAERYAEANRNIGFDPSIITDLKRRNRNAGEFLQTIYEHGQAGWERYWRENGFWRDTPEPGQGHLDSDGFEKHLGVDFNTLGDIAGYILGSATKPLGSDDDGTLNIFNTSTGAPSWIYDSLDSVGLNSKVYRPKIYTVIVNVSNTLVTASKSQARSARSKGYDSVVYYGSDLVDGAPEVAVFDPRNVRIIKIEVV